MKKTLVDSFAIVAKKKKGKGVGRRKKKEKGTTPGSPLCFLLTCSAGRWYGGKGGEVILLPPFGGKRRGGGRKKGKNDRALAGRGRGGTISWLLNTKVKRGKNCIS